VIDQAKHISFEIERKAFITNGAACHIESRLDAIFLLDQLKLGVPRDLLPQWDSGWVLFSRGVFEDYRA
jgi:hypothetical protein